MIIIVDYGIGNLGSIKNMFNRIGVSAIIAGDLDIIGDAEKLVLPGVGAFDNAIQRINKRGLREEVVSSITAPAGDTLIGFTELDYVLQNSNGLFVIPIIDNWTHSATDAINAGGLLVGPSNANSTSDTWRIQSDLRVIVHEDDLSDIYST